MTKVANNKEALSKRLRRFFENVPDERRDLLEFLNAIKDSSDIYIFGGLIRDICLHGISAFRSDVDVVVRVLDRAAFEALLTEFKCKKNKFGGYRIQKDRWMIDLWEFESTWAFSKGYVEPLNPRALLETTFFNWDAALYDFKKDKLYCKDHYFEELNHKFLDVNLKENPNKYGAFIRALRLLSREYACTGKELSKFIAKHLDETPDDKILRYEQRNFSYNILTPELLSLLRERAKELNYGENLSWLEERQLKLFKNEEYADA